jgi:hypothetical protein
MHNRKPYFTIEVFYKHTPLEAAGANYVMGSNIKKYRLINMTSEAIKSFRETVFMDGLLIWDVDDSAHAWIVPPFNIVHIDVFRQAYFFKYEKNLSPLKKQDDNTTA